MRITPRVLLSLILVLLLISSAFPIYAAELEADNSQLTKIAEVNVGSGLPMESDDDLVVGFSDEASDQLIATADTTLSAELDKKNIKYEKIEKGKKASEGAPLLVTVKLKNKSDKGEAKDALMACEGVSYVEPLTYLYAQDFNDTYVNQQWGLTPIDAYPAWNDNTNLSEVTIAIVDTGVLLNHADLSASIVAGYDFIDNDSDPTDMKGHGTHVAGIAAALCNNGIGIASPAGGAKIMAVRVLDSAGYGTSVTVSNGIYYAADHNANIINMSLGGNMYSEAIDKAVQYAISKGCLIVASAGNDSRKTLLSYPARLEGVIAAASLTEGSQDGYYESDFSNYEASLSSRIIHAPGRNILSTYYSHSTSYVYMSGTSMAAPYISGMAAALLAKGGYTGSLYDELLEETVKKPRVYQTASGVVTDPGNVMNILNDNGIMNTISEKTYTVNFSANGGNPAPAAQAVSYGGIVTTPLPMSRAGYTFDGWYTSSSFIGTPYDFSTPVYGAFTLHAKWLEVPVYYNVTFHTNGGTPEPIAQTIPKGKYTLEPSVTRNGYIFAGWYTTPNFLDSTYLFTTPVTANLELYAKWLATGPVCEVKGTSYNSLDEGLSNAVNGDTVKLLSDVLYEKELLIDGKTITFDLNGHNLNVFNPTQNSTSANGLKVINNGNVSYIGSGEFNVSARTYGYGVLVQTGGKAKITNVLSDNCDSGYVGVRAAGAGQVTITGNTSEIEIVENSSVTVEGNITGNFVNSGARVYKGNLVVKGNVYASDIGVYSSDMNNNIKVFGNIYADNYMNYSGVYVGTGIMGNAGTVEVYGNINALSFGVSAMSSNINVIIHGDVNVTDNRGTSGVGAELSNGAKVTIDGNVNSPIFARIAKQDLTVDAKTIPSTKVSYFMYTGTDSYGTSYLWVKDQSQSILSYNVAFVANGGLPAPVNQIVSQGSIVAAPNDMVRPGYIFDAWYTNSTFSGSPYNFSTPVNENLTLYAKWIAEPIKYTVSFVSNGGTPSPADQVVAAGSTAETPTIMLKAGYKFGGWYTSSNLKGKEFTFTTPITSNVVLYAKWVRSKS